MARRVELSDERRRRLTDWFGGRDAVTPSVSYAVFDRDGLLFAHGIGEFARDGRTPTPDTVYRICSMTKSFTIAAVLVLRDRGLLSLEDPVTRHVPAFQNHVDTDGHETVVTVAMLMDNSSGLPEDNRWADHHLDITTDELADLIEVGFTYSAEPGTEFQYANIGYALLGLIIENASGRDYASYVTETVLEPLGLQSTRFDWRDYPSDRHGGAGIAQGFQSFDDGVTWMHRPFVETGALASAGALFSNLTDIAAWSSWLSRGFDLDASDDILSRASRRSMQRIRTPIDQMIDRRESPEVQNFGYGYGLMIEHDERFGPIVQHSGGLPGFSTNMRWHCSSGIGVVVFANTNGVTSGRWASQMLREILVEHQVSARLIELWPSTWEAARAVDAMVAGSGQVRELDDLLTPNVLSDVPPEIRDARLAEALHTIGAGTASGPVPPLASRLVSTVSPAQVTWRLPGSQGQIECLIEMTSARPGGIQRLEVTVVVPGPARASNVTEFYEPVLPTGLDSSSDRLNNSAQVLWPR